jgi:antitoxin (DNA-binding transcriptional repressor) of toxin-antitoxin stability system
MIVTAKDLRFNISELFDTLGKGEDIIITYRGKAKAKLVGLNEKREREDIAFGMWSDKNDDVDEVVRELRKGRRFDI